MMIMITIIIIIIIIIIVIIIVIIIIIIKHQPFFTQNKNSERAASFMGRCTSLPQSHRLTLSNYMNAVVALSLKIVRIWRSF